MASRLAVAPEAGPADRGNASPSRHRLPWRGAAWTVAVVLVLIVVSALVGDYQIQLLTQAFIFGLAAVSLDVTWGYTGIPDLGHALWFGIGALAVGMTTTTISSTGLVTSFNGGVGHYALGIVIGIAVALIIALAVGRFSFFSTARDVLAGASQFYVAVVTLALTTAATTLYTQVSWTGGDNGLFGFSASGVSDLDWYFITGVLLLLAVLGAFVLVRSDFGLLMRAVRDNERRARYLACDVEAVKRQVFAGSAAVAAFAGALYGMSVGIVSSSLFSFVLATEMLVWVAVGGRATIIGPAIGAIAMSLIGSQLSQRWPSQWTLIEGALFVAVVVFIPDGAYAHGAALVRRLRPGATAGASGRRFVAAPPAAVGAAAEPVAITIRELTFSYGDLHVLRGVDLDVHSGELLCIVGPNGAGKSTLMEVLTDGTRPHGGSVTYHHADVVHRNRPPHAIARGEVTRKFQIPSLFASLTVAETVLLASRRGRRPSLWRRSVAIPVSEPVLEILSATGLTGHEDILASELAHGLKQGLEIAAAVAAEPRVLILDEPTAGLTANERHVIGEVLRALVARGIAVILIEHDLDFVQRIADRIAVLHEGRVLEVGTPEAVSASAVVRQAYVGVVGA
jgi:branched-chain amino acid transport system permease protein